MFSVYVNGKSQIRVYLRHRRARRAPVGHEVPGRPAATWPSICVHPCASVCIRVHLWFGPSLRVAGCPR